MADVGHTIDITEELNFGESSEVGIISRWAQVTTLNDRAERLVKTPVFAPFDFLALDKKGFPVAYVEVKRRRTPFARYGDAMCPLSKHHEAITIRGEYHIPSLLVTEYSCGTIVEVDLSVAPAKTSDVVRRDRPGMKPVLHAFYVKNQLTVVKQAS